MMTPEPHILKRKRSKPSNWWAANSSTSTPPQTDSTANRSQISKTKFSKFKERERTKPRSGGYSRKKGQREYQDVQEEYELANPRTKESRDKVLAANKAHGNADASSHSEIAKKKKPHSNIEPSTEGEREQGSPKRRGRIAALPADGEIGDENSEVAITMMKEYRAPASTRSRPENHDSDELGLDPVQSKFVHASINGTISPVASEPPATHSKILKQDRLSRNGAEMPFVQMILKRTSNNLQSGGEAELQNEDVSKRKLARKGSSKPSKPMSESLENPLIKKPITRGIRSDYDRDRRNGKQLNSDIRVAGQATESGLGMKRRRPHIVEGEEEARGRKLTCGGFSQANTRASSNQGAAKSVEVPKRSSHRKRKSRREGRMLDNSNSELYNDVPQEDKSEDDELLPRQQITALTRRVSRQTIEAKWDPLSVSCVEKISQLLEDVQRPVIVRLNDEQRRIQASIALKVISRRLVSKISKGLPFPHSARNHRQDDFDFEKILDQNRLLEIQLTPVLHANELLEAEISKEMAWLASEKNKLAELESNAKKEVALRNESVRRFHQIMRSDRAQDLDTVDDDICLTMATAAKMQDAELNGTDDEDVQVIFETLHDHVDSIHGNLEQVDGLIEAMARSKAAVQAALFDHLDSGHYETVTLGLK